MLRTWRVHMFPAAHDASRLVSWLVEFTRCGDFPREPTAFLPLELVSELWGSNLKLTHARAIVRRRCDSDFLSLGN